MRTLAFAAAAPILLLAIPANADSFIDLEGGLTTPVGDDDWNDAVESSPKLAFHAGSIPSTVGGMLSVDWTPENTDTMSQTFPGGSQEVSAHRFRMLVNVAFQSPVKAKLMVTGRAGVGIDIAHASYQLTVGPFSGEANDTDVGFGFEVGAGLWAKVGSVAIGGELAIPIGHHDHTADEQGEISFEYTSYDIDLLFGVRIMAGQ